MNTCTNTSQTNTLRLDVSVVIPVYRAEKFLRSAVESALAQIEVREVIIVEDDSPDDSIGVARQLESESSGRVRLVKHADMRNHGAGASRNLGAELATSRYLAFLDADDVYLPGRFVHDKAVFAANPDADGVYNALGTQFHDEEGRSWYRKSGFPELTTMKKIIKPEHLFFHMNPLGRLGRFSFDALTLRREAFFRTPGFSNMPIGEDTLLSVQMAIMLRLYPGNISNAVALRGVHSSNRVQDIKALKKGTINMFERLEEWLIEQSATEYHRRVTRLAYMSKAVNFADFWRLATTFPGLLRRFETWFVIFRWFLCRRYPDDPFLPGLRCNHCSMH